MPRFTKHAELGLRWVRCGWRLYVRNPWRLGGMGVCGAAVIAVLAAIPMVGRPIIGLLAPALLASFYIAVDDVARQRLKLPPALRAVALKQAPRELFAVARDENRLLLAVMTGLCSLAVVVLADVAAWLVAGTAWTNRAFGVGGFVGVTFAGIVLLAIYLLLAASLVYSLPLAMLQHEALMPAVAESFRRAWRYVYALLPLCIFAAVPLLLSAAAGLHSRALGYAAGFAAGAIVLPVLAGALYCSYRTIFPELSTAKPVERAMVGAKQAG